VFADSDGADRKRLVQKLRGIVCRKPTGKRRSGEALGTAGPVVHTMEPVYRLNVEDIVP